MLREALKDMGREDMIGAGKNALIPKEEPEAHRHARLQNKLGQSTRGRPGGKGAAGQGAAGRSTTSNGKPAGKTFGKPGSKPGVKSSGKKPGKKLQKSIAEKAGVKQEGAKKSGKPKFKKR